MINTIPKKLISRVTNSENGVTLLVSGKFNSENLSRFIKNYMDTDYPVNIYFSPENKLITYSCAKIRDSWVEIDADGLRKIYEMADLIS